MKVVLSALLFISSVCWAGLKTDKITATDLGNNWYQHDQFGTFYASTKSGWYYHLDHEWIYVDEWDDNGTWMYMPVHDEYYYPESNSSELPDTSGPKQVSPGWMWSKANIYPQLYSDLIKGWMYGYGKGIYYDYRTKYRYGNGFDYWELDFTDSNKTTEEILEKMDAYFQLFSHDFENDPYAEPALPFDINPDWRPLGSLTTISLSFPLEILSTDNNWSKLIQLCEENPNEMENRGIVKIEKDEGVVKLVSFTGTLILENVTFPNTSEVLMRSRDGGLNFGDANITFGDVIFIENVKHLSISSTDALTDAHFDRSKGNGHINSTSTLPNGRPVIKIRAR